MDDAARAKIDAFERDLLPAHNWGGVKGDTPDAAVIEFQGGEGKNVESNLELPIPRSAKCQHAEFLARVEVVQHPAVGHETRYMAEVTIVCMKCGIPMRFLGLPQGLDLAGASVSPDGREGRFACVPEGA